LAQPVLARVSAKVGHVPTRATPVLARVSQRVQLRVSQRVQLPVLACVSAKQVDIKYLLFAICKINDDYPFESLTSILCIIPNHHIDASHFEILI
jgi:hypothetical protein